MTRTAILCVATLALLPTFGKMQDVQGRVLVVSGNGARSVAVAAVVTVSCGEASASSVTDRNGLYRVRAPRPGACTIQVRYSERVSTTVSVNIPYSGLGANLELQAWTGGWILRRVS